MTDRTRVTGWNMGVGPLKRMEVFLEGHVTPDQAIEFAGERGMNLDGHINIAHEVFNLPKWYKAGNGEIRGPFRTRGKTSL